MTFMELELPVWIERLPKNPTAYGLMIYCQPGAKKTEVQGLHDGRLKVRLAAPPVEGKANDALIAWLSKLIRLPQHSIRLASGELSRIKCLELSGLSAEQLRLLISLSA